MSKYRKLFPRMWTDERFRHLDIPGKLTAIYCIGSEQCNRVGLYRFSVALAAEEIGLGAVALDTVLDTVCRTLFWQRDKRGRVLYLPTWWRYNAPDNVNAMIGYLKDLGELPQTPLLQVFLENRAFLSDTLYDTLFSVGSTYQIYGMPYQEQEKEQEQDTELEKEKDPEKEIETDPTASKDARKKNTYPPEFETWWAAYPKQRRVEKLATLKAWKAARKQVSITIGGHFGMSEDVLQDRVEAYAASSEGRSIYTPAPKRWLANGRYDDDPASWERNGDTADTDDTFRIPLLSERSKTDECEP